MSRSTVSAQASKSATIRVATKSRGVTIALWSTSSPA
eukprot:CAMPEP_0118980092 /NCGR_PEP_ID=MMETSP1173-20130426/27535_1 /TAXON_ID=1034831 /ORGANISM="Rhizochromulina marina cf, Strain CCMP1243" /LENGTH=36 /DNA_ID= /DNA_START= /DNA_END= /DNA_ORIENTATION=